MTWRIFGMVAGALATVGVMVALAAPGHSPVLDPVAQAADTTASAGTAAFTLSGSVTSGGRQIPIEGSGAVDMRSRRARVSMSLPLPILGSVKTDAIVDGTDVYVRAPDAVAALIPGGKPWLKADLLALGNKAGFDPKQLAPSNQANPAAMLKALDAVGSSHKVGIERVAGAQTTHYRATIDPKKAVARIPGGGEALKQMLNGSGLRSIPLDVWIDGSGRVRREAIKFSAAGTAADLTMSFTRFGVPVDTTPPAADQVTDVGGLLGGS